MGSRSPFCGGEAVAGQRGDSAEEPWRGHGWRQILLFFCPHFFNCGKMYIKSLKPCKNVQLNGVKSIHIVVQPSPPPFPEFFSFSD